MRRDMKSVEELRQEIERFVLYCIGKKLKDLLLKISMIFC